ncbi:unnamed protein product [Lepeophtheirus salmonis]|uniref:(salmon louse) hypothetical protein n=1 Tax=Lepeophtheirus salmonis TaxID=72036 RepID=A0A7R8D107_LEPSM|nr:unnamed protein product [Lepeophtheirus salmonis]CAF2988666.1 unnamed protein product [Lepeophtheirus salmonis]
MDQFIHPFMDWNSPGDLRKRFNLFKQKCQLIFEGPLWNELESTKVRFLLLWAEDMGLKIYNNAIWEHEGDALQLKYAYEKLEPYSNRHSNQILARYKLRSLTQGDRTIEAFINEAK